ncbi:phage major capsid protein [Klebsiella pneumoniae]|uniref:phage major capsid protein n=1 Tax=Klebsiella pneumoniae TaxID=573 RepID=UPI000E2A4A13|nr:phage major capsid protein [Klebsiella pneumoniae]SXB99898.1 phage major capsid protein, HK97 family [Klebsiella pneumoniae]
MEIQPTQQIRAVTQVQINKAIDEEDLTVRIAFASEQPVRREIRGQIYDEILLCNPENVDLSRINQGMCPLLIEHSMEKQIGKVERASIDADKICRATVRFSDSGSAPLIFNMIKEGIREGISVGYNVIDQYLNGNQIIVTKWQPYEISSVACPADFIGSGVARSLNSTVEINLTEGIRTMDQEENKLTDETRELPQVDEVNEPTLTPDAEPVEDSKTTFERDEDGREFVEIEGARFYRADIVDEKDSPEDIDDQEVNDQANTPVIDSEERSLKVEAEDKRVRDIKGIAELFNVDATQALNNNTSVEEFKNSIRSLNTDNKLNVKETPKMEKNVIHEMVESIIADTELKTTAKRGTRGYEVATRAIDPSTNTTSGAGLVQEVYEDSYIPELLKRSVLGDLYPTLYTGLAGRGTLSIPKADGVAPAFKVYVEGEEVETSIASFSKINMAPKILAGEIPVSKSLILTAPNAARFVQEELLRHAAVGLESYVFAQIKAKAPVVESAVAGKITEADVQAAMAELGSKNVDTRRCVAVMNSKTVAEFRLQPVLGNVAAVAMIEGQRTDDRWLNSELKVFVSEHIDDGVVLIGQFDQLLIAQWEGQEVDYDTTTYRRSGTVAYRVWNFIDVALAHDTCFLQLTKKA